MKEQVDGYQLAKCDDKAGIQTFAKAVTFWKGG
jgi:hypothetical protein